jgi:hypothetical protein
VGNGRRENAIEAEPHEALDELMNGEEYRQRREEEFAAMFHFGEGGTPTVPRPALPRKFAVVEKHLGSRRRQA